jgi:hypothetical protein
MNLSQRIIKASLDVGGFSADKSHEKQGYKYISADKVLDRAGKALAENGVIIYPSITEQGIGSVQPDGGKPYNSAYVKFEMIVTDGETERVIPWVGYGTDYSTQDKAIYKAITSGHKYFLMKLLSIGIGNEDGEHDAESDTQVHKPSAQPNQVPRQTQASSQYSGTINPQIIVDAGMADNIPNAGALINALKIAGKPAAEYMPIVALYRNHRNAGKSVEEAAKAALNGEVI